jgi:hypothetical protein
MDIWRQTLDTLRLQTPDETYNRFLRDTWLASNGGDSYTIGCNSPLTADWLQNRMAQTITAALAASAGKSPADIEIDFVVADPPQETTQATDTAIPPQDRRRRREQYYRVDNLFIDAGYAAHLGPYALAVYNLLARRANDDDLAWPGKGSIADELGISKSQVKRAIRALAEYSIINVERRQRMGGSWSSNVYTLLDVSAWKPIR